jgi:predicted MFS family arabinose efflux permease
VALVQSAVVLLGGLGAPLAGAALDRWGPRRLFTGGAALAALGLGLASQARTLPLLVLAHGLVAGAGLSLLGSPPNLVVVARWFPDRRGSAIALADLGTPLGAVLSVPLVQLVIERWGWRTALLALAAALLGLVVPANLFQRLPAPPPGRARAAPAGSLRAALGRPTFGWLVGLRFLAGVGFALVNLHALAAAVGAGVPPVRAAAAVGSVALVSLPGRLAVGWLVDRVGPAAALTAAWASGLAGLGCLTLLTATGHPGWLAGFVLLYGLAQGSAGIVATAAATAAFDGPAVGAVTGLVALASGPGEALGAWIGGAAYDRTGGYAAALGLAAAALLAGLGTAWRAERAERPRTWRATGPPAR